MHYFHEKVRSCLCTISNTSSSHAAKANNHNNIAQQRYYAPIFLLCCCRLHLQTVLGHTSSNKLVVRFVPLRVPPTTTRKSSRKSVVRTTTKAVANYTDNAGEEAVGVHMQTLVCTNHQSTASHLTRRVAFRKNTLVSSTTAATGRNLKLISLHSCCHRRLPPSYTVVCVWRAFGCIDAMTTPSKCD